MNRLTKQDIREIAELTGSAIGNSWAKLIEPDTHINEVRIEGSQIHVYQEDVHEDNDREVVILEITGSGEIIEDETHFFYKTEPPVHGGKSQDDYEEYRNRFSGPPIWETDIKSPPRVKEYIGSDEWCRQEDVKESKKLKISLKKFMEMSEAQVLKLEKEVYEKWIKEKGNKKRQGSKMSETL